MLRGDFGLQEIERMSAEKWRADMLVEQVKIRRALEHLVGQSFGIHLELPEAGEAEVNYHIIVKRIGEEAPDGN